MLSKTAIQQQWNIVFTNSGPGYTVLAVVDIDNEKWYTVHVNKDIAAWTRTQSQDQWYEHPYEQPSRYNFHEPSSAKFDVQYEHPYEHPYEQPSRYNFHEPSSAKFDVHYELLTILKLTWGKL